MIRVEKALVNSRLMTLLHRDIALPRVLRMARHPLEGPLLEVGCGQGTTTSGLLKRLPAIHVTATDYDAHQVERARERLGAMARVERADATALPYQDGSYGTVVEMNAMHHIPDWRRAVAEIHRVLTPAGQFLFMDYTRNFLWGTVATEKTMPGAFTAIEFEAALDEAGFSDVVVRGAWIIMGRAVKRS